MKRFSCAWLALASALAIVCLEPVAARPRYGGTLRVAMQAALRSLDPAEAAGDAGASVARTRLAGLAFETLVRLDEHGRFQPLLAESWQKDAQGRRWEFRVRQGVRTHDGGTLTASAVASALQRLNPAWGIRAEGMVVRIDAARPAPDLLWDVASADAAITTTGGAQAVGTGPFRIERWEAGRQAVLRAHEDYWGGRPFLDAIHVEMARRLADQLADLELGRADIVSIQPQDVRRIEQRGLREVAGLPVELVALVVGDARSGPADDAARKALAMALDRAAFGLLLQRRAEPARSLLPQWLSGYAFLLEPEENRAAARTLAQSLPAAAKAWRLQADPADAMLQSLAGRIVLDAREASLSASLAPSGAPGGSFDARLVRRTVPVTTPERALRELLSALGAATSAAAGDEAAAGPGTAEAAWRLESAVIDRHLVIPLVHVPELFGVGPRVAGWPGPSVQPPGGLQLERAWLRMDHP